MRLLLSICTLIAAGIALFAGALLYVARADGNCDQLATDLNHDCAINSGDLGIVARDVVLVSFVPTWTPAPGSTSSPEPTASPTTGAGATATETQTPTSTPSSTPTRAASSTPVPTATNTPETSSNSVAAILNDSRGNHDGAICGVSGYDWEHHGVIHSVGPGGYPQATGWWVAEWDCGRQQSGVRLEIRSFRAYVLASGTWTRITNGTTWCQRTPPQTVPNIGSCPLGGNTGPLWDMPNANEALHGANGHTFLPANVVCILTILEARTNIPARLMLAAGADYWNDAAGSIRAAGFGRFVMLGTDWRFVNFSSCSSATLAANPPPLR